MGKRGYGGDSWGFGTYPGQYAMAVLSRYPIDARAARTFQLFRWRDLEGHHLPEGFYSESETARLRLSSKSHWDVPVLVRGLTLHLWVSHPTPPVFDGPEDRNGRRNFDEIKFWVAYLEGHPGLYDDRGRVGGYDSSEPFVVAGDLNADPRSEEAFYDGRPAIAQLLDHPAIRDPGAILSSDGARALLASAKDGHRGEAEIIAQATADFGGGSRVDYLLPDVELEIVDGGVFWPDPETDPEGHLLALEASDHRLVWLDLRLE